MSEFDSRPEFTDQTLTYLTQTSREHRKKLGQFFTPRSIRTQLLDLVPRREFVRILDPACGTGEFLLTAAERWPAAELEGWDVDSRLCTIARRNVPDARIRRCDALTSSPTPQFDLVIGNPPYYEFSPAPAVRAAYRDIINGRANIFSFFIKLGLNLLTPDGVLAYVVPPSMNNGAFFANLRQYILDRSGIVALKLLDSASLFQEAQQRVMLLVLQHGKQSRRYTFRKTDRLIFSPQPKQLAAAYCKCTSLAEQGFQVCTGRLVWNQHRDKLTADARRGIRLIWASNIGQGRLHLDNSRRRPAFVAWSPADRGPAIVVNRVTGSGREVRLRAAVVPAEQAFVAENHVNVIFPPHDKRLRSVRFLYRLAEHICSAEVSRMMGLVTGNTQVSARELELLLPIPLELFSSAASSSRVQRVGK